MATGQWKSGVLTGARAVSRGSSLFGREGVYGTRAAPLVRFHWAWIGTAEIRGFRRVRSPDAGCDEERNRQRRGTTTRREELSSGPVNGTTTQVRIHAEPKLPPAPASTSGCGWRRRLLWLRLLTEEDFPTFSEEQLCSQQTT